MLMLLSPAKKLDETGSIPACGSTQPRLIERSKELIDVLVTMSPDQVGALMGISAELAVRNVERYRAWEPPFTTANARQAMYLFAGDTYVGLDARRRFDESDLVAASACLRILSGLYGLLRPTDLIAPYRLEMGTRLRTSRGDSLYEFWSDTLTALIRDDLAASPGDRFVVNLASNEYFSAVDPARLDAEVITPRFEDENPQGRYKVISFFAKRARGDMAGWLVTHRARQASDLVAYDGLGYRYVEAGSAPGAPLFRRPASAR